MNEKLLQFNFIDHAFSDGSPASCENDTWTGYVNGNLYPGLTADTSLCSVTGAVQLYFNDPLLGNGNTVTVEVTSANNGVTYSNPSISLTHDMTGTPQAYTYPDEWCWQAGCPRPEPVFNLPVSAGLEINEFARSNNPMQADFIGLFNKGASDAFIIFSQEILFSVLENMLGS